MALSAGLLVLLGAAGTAQAQQVQATDGLMETRTEISWPAQTGSGILFRIERNGDLLAIVAGTETTYGDATGDPDAIYNYCVKTSSGGTDTLLGCDDGYRVVFKPAGLTATDGTLDDAVRITWTDRSRIETGYDLLRDDFSGSGPVLLASLPANTSLYRDTSAAPNVLYLYCIQARDADGATSDLVCDQGTRGMVLPPLRVAATDGQFTGLVRITWDDQNDGENGFTIYRDGVSIGLTGPDLTAFDDATAALGTTYEYCVTVTKGGVESVRACDAGRRGGLTPPGDVAASQDTHDDRVEVTWSDAANTEDGFEVFRDGTLLATVTAGTESYGDRAAAQQVDYTYCVRAFSNADVTPSYSAQACATGRRAAVLAPTEVTATDDDLEDRVGLTWKNPATTTMLFNVYRDGTLVMTLPPSHTRYEDRSGIASGVAMNYCLSSSTVVGGAASAQSQIMQVVEQAAAAAAVEQAQRAEEGPLRMTEQARALRVRVEAMARAQGGDLVESAQACDTGSRLLKAPTNVEASYEAFEDRVEITWVDNSAVNLGFIIYRQVGTATPTVADTVSAGRTSYSDFAGDPDVEYTYHVTAYDEFGESDADTDTGFRTLAAPTRLVASDGTHEDRIVLTWTDESRAETGYRITRRGVQIADLPANTTTYADASAIISTGFSLDLYGDVHTYSVVAYDDHGASEAVEDQGFAALLPPTSLGASTTYPDRIVLAWTDASTHNESYTIYRDGSPLNSASAMATGYTDTTATGTHTYCVQAMMRLSKYDLPEEGCAQGALLGVPVVPGRGDGVGIVDKLTASDGADSDQFGWSVALDGRYAVAGARSNKFAAATQSGVAYVFYNDPATGWTQQAKLTSIAPMLHERFGSAVAIGGDVAVVGAPGHLNERGAIYFFERKGKEWGLVCPGQDPTICQAPWLRAADGFGNGISGDNFGYAVDIDGDYAVVGAPGANGSTGAAYVFYNDPVQGWTQQAKLARPSLQGGGFGGAVAIRGDVVFVGARLGQSTVYVYGRSGSTWTVRQMLQATDGGEVQIGSFGSSIALGANRAVIGADGQGNNRGAAYVFDRSGSTWAQQAVLTADDGVAHNYFGISVALDGDRIMVGASGQNEKAQQAGAVYYFRLIDGAWRELVKFLPDDGRGGATVGEFMGASIAMDANHLIAGAFGAQRTARNPIVRTGALYVQPLVAAPAAVEASDGAFADRIQIKWEDRAVNEEGFNIYRIDADGTAVPVGTAPADAETYDDFSAVPGGGYTYQVTAYNPALQDLNPFLGESDRVGTLIAPPDDIGWRPTNGTLSGRVAALGGGGTEDARVCLLPSPNKALLFDGTGGTVEADTMDLSGDALTIEYWFRGDHLQSAVRQQIGDNFIVSGWNGQHILSNSGGTTGISVGAAATDGQWHHVAMTWTYSAFPGFGTGTGYLRSYLDGQAVSTTKVVTGSTPLPKIDAPVFLGSANGAGEFTNGQLDEVRIWNVARTQAEIEADMNRPLRGDEPGLVGYWPLDQGERAVAADLTGAGHNGAFHNGVYWADAGAPLDICATTDEEGNYTLSGLNYGESTAFTVTPALGERSFDPAFKKITLSEENPVQNEVDFTDETAFTVSGLVQFAGTTCPAPDVGIHVAEGNEPAVLKGTTASDGTFSVSVDPSTDPTDVRRILPMLGGGDDVHVFSPRDTSFFADADVSGLAFADTKKRVLRGFFGGSCNADIGTATLKIFTENGCYDQEIQVHGDYSVELPPQKYLVQVTDITGTPPALVAEVTEFFDHLGAREVDLAAADDTLDFLYRAPITLAIAGFPDAPAQCAATGFATVDADGNLLGTTLPSVPLIGEFERVPLTFTVFEDYGAGGTCPVDAGTVTVFDHIGDVEAPVVLEIENGEAAYTTIGASPDTFEGRVVEGVNRSYQKQLTAVAEVDGVEPVTESRWAIVDGFREKTATFVSAVTDEIPMLILHDPPGSNSYSYLEEGITTCHSFSNVSLTGGGAGADIDVVLGFKAGVGIGFVTESGAGLALRTRTVAGSFTENVTGGLETCITTNKRYATSADETWVGEDVFLGVALNLIFAEADVIDADGGSCAVEVSKTLAADLNEADPYETTFLYGESHIKYSLIPALEGLLELVGDDDTIEGDIKGIPQHIRLRDALQNWRDHLAFNDENVAAALQSPEENRSFSAGTEYEYAHTTDSTDFSGVSTRIYVNSENGIGAVITGGYDQTFLATFEVMHESGPDSSDATTATKSLGYVLSDGDTGDFFSVDVGSDPVYGTPVFGTKSGRSSNPWEAGTQKRDLPLVEVATPVVSGVNPDEAALVRLTITNASESNERRAYILDDPRHLNPNSAVIGLRGDAINEEKFLIDGGKSISVTLAVERGPELYDYDSLAVIVYPEKEMEIWQADTRQPFPLSDTAYFSVSFNAPCSNISMLRPVENWRLNAATIGDSLEVILHEFDLSRGVTSLGLEYRLQGTSTWLPAVNVQSSSLNGADSWAARWLPPRDGAYEVRAFTACPVGRVTSATLPGVVDTKPPQVFGTPSPTDQVLALGSDIAITFDEAITCESVRTQGALANAALAYVDGPDAGTNIADVEATCDGRTLLLAPPETFDWAGAEGLTLEARLLTNVLDGTGNPVVLTDVAGNPIEDAIAWPFTVRRSAFAWSPANVEADLTRGAPKVIETKLVNGRAVAADFTLPATFNLIPESGGAAIPLVPSVTADSIVSGGSRAVTFTLPDTLALGTYTAVLRATRVEGGTAQETIPFHLTAHVVCEPPPEWSISPAAFEYTMTLTAQLFVDGTASQDPNDIVVAMVGSEVRGVAHVAEVAPGTYRLTMIIHSNTISGEAITFEVWDDDQCTRYAQTGKTLVFEHDAAHGTVSQPVVLEAPPTTGPSDIALAAGWTWFSLNRTPPDASVNAVLADVVGTPTDVVKSQAKFSLFDDDFGWVGTLATLDPGPGYQIRLQQSNTFEQQGAPVDVAATPVVVRVGWNWLGYLPQQAMPVNDALADFDAEADDVIKSQAAFAQYVDATTGWAGSLMLMEPGLGYQLNTTSTDAAFFYPATPPPLATAAPTAHDASMSASAKSGVERAAQHEVEASAEPPDWSVDPHAYAFNMTVTARLLLGGAAVQEGSLVAVFAGEECRGVASVQTVSGLNQPLTFLVVHGNAQQEQALTVRLYDATSDSVYAVAGSLSFTADAVLGSIREPLVLEAATTTATEEAALPTAFALEQNFPNPFNPKTTIRFALPEPVAVRLVVYDVLGREVARLVDAKQSAGRHEVVFDAERYASGVYFYRIEAGSFVQLHRMLLVK